jgi:creatinine amidohydrolase/Fe(II)-dependent formamide hydrolase-like protein
MAGRIQSIVQEARQVGMKISIRKLKQQGLAKQSFRGVFMVNPHIGSDFDEFLNEEGIHEEVTAAAIKRIIAWQLEKLMKSKHITKTEIINT